MVAEEARKWPFGALWLTFGCTSLGPMPAMTGVPSAPLERPGMEAQVAVVPGYYLSSGTQEKPKSAALPQLAGVFEPDRLLHAPGVLVGARYAGDGKAGAALEPLVGYRAFVDGDKRFSVAGVGFLAYASGSQRGASFDAWRGGGELGMDVRLTPPSRYAELHANLGATFTVLDARGHYCVDQNRIYGVDCPDNVTERTLVDASASGVFPSGHVGASLDLARHWRAPFHGLRLGLDAAGGLLPTLQSGEQRAPKLYGSAGLSVTLGFGATTSDGS